MNPTLLSSIIWLPLLSAVVLLILSANNYRSQLTARIVLFLVTAINVALSVVLLSRFNPSGSTYQLVEKYDWIKTLGVSYIVGVDGISLWSLISVNLIMFLLAAFPQSILTITKGTAVALLTLQTAMCGTLLSLDLVLFYLFWELMLFPMFFLMISGGTKDRSAGFVFVLYTLTASVFMLAAILALGLGAGSFNLETVLSTSSMSTEMELLLFLGFFSAFAVKVPLFPFHGWLIGTQRAASPIASIIVAALLFQMGVYGFLRFGLPLFPRAIDIFAPYLALLGAIGVIYGALVAWKQTELRAVAAYSLLSHLGLCALALAAVNSTALLGTVLHTVNHGISTTALFFIIAAIELRAGSGLLSNLGGFVHRAPRLAVFLFITILSLIALPLSNGFIGEFLIFSGALQSFPALTVMAMIGTVVGVVYSLQLYQKSCLGEQTKILNDLSIKECLWLAPCIMLVLLLGVQPQLLSKYIEPSAKELLSSMQSRKRALNNNTQNDFIRNYRNTRVTSVSLSMKN